MEMIPTDKRYERIWEHDGHVCAVMLHPIMLHRCGYVWVAPESPLEGVRYEDDRVCDAPVHGGLTFSNELHVDYVDKFCNDAGSWAFGFDCAHFNDMPDYDAGIERYGDREEFHSEFMKGMLAPETTFGMPKHMWTLEEVIEETERLCEWLADVERSEVAA